MGNQTIIDLFAGPGIGGWDEGLAMLGRRDVVGVEWDEAACLTAEAAGHRRILADVAALDPIAFVKDAALTLGDATRTVEGLILSPPCQGWSLAGKQLGKLDRGKCHELADRMAAGDDSIDWTEWADPRSHLIAQPVRWVRDLRPEWVALEEVPAVLDYWHHLARIFRAWGYHVWVGVLNAADYGVPQTRKRAILLASRTRKVHRPTPTHSRVPSMFTAGWVSMADALGWPHDGMVGFPRRDEDDPTKYRERDLRPATEQAFTITEKVRSWTRFLADTNVSGVTSEVVMDRRTNSRGADGTLYPTPPVTLDRPAPTITGKNPPAWALRALEAAKPGEPLRASDRPEWTTGRPATTVQADPRIGRPGRKDWAGGESQFDHGSVRVTIQEAGVLQSFPADYPWQGVARRTNSRSKQYEQVGNAVPPRLAAHVLAGVMGGPHDYLARINSYYEEARKHVA